MPKRYTGTLPPCPLTHHVYAVPLPPKCPKHYLMFWQPCSYFLNFWHTFSCFGTNFFVINCLILSKFYPLFFCYQLLYTSWIFGTLSNIFQLYGCFFMFWHICPTLHTFCKFAHSHAHFHTLFFTFALFQYFLSLKN